MKYVDFRSLYAWVCEHVKFPVGHPKVLFGNNCHELTGPQNTDILKVRGLIFRSFTTKKLVSSYAICQIS